ncbi:uncharacterized protein LOC132751009 [Ruditapes philippinarum]|uniref:uncharacterized protein LOC132751009 n=1 Tax=Ruditapes philippinarum TaxID=129788 RepID=UPI00295A9446|nr:uncharacterized protein LOC132751009 [Ruditapes philippinarum]
MAVPGKRLIKIFSSSTTSMGSEEDYKVYCQLCDRSGPRLPAHGFCINCSEHLCQTCCTVHRQQTFSRHHVLLDKSSMPQSLSPGISNQSDSFKKLCPKHGTELIMFYCHDHKALLCSVCVSNEHTAASCKLNYIPDISGQSINSKEYQDVLKEINDMTERCNKSLKDMKKINDESNQSLADALADINKFRTKINQRLDKMEKQVKEAAKVIQKDNSKNLTQVETVCGDVSKSLKLASNAIKHFNISKQPSNLFVELKQTEQMIKDFGQSVARLSEYDVREYTFEPNEAILNLLHKEGFMGTLKGRAPSFKSRQCPHLDKICIKTSQDKNPCWITGMTLLTPDLLIIADFSDNMAIKMVDIYRKSVLSQQCFDSRPRDVTSVSHNELAVTLPDIQTIQFIYVSRNNLTKNQLLSTLKVDGNCWGIGSYKDKLVVSFKSLLRPAKVQILLINGTVLHTIEDENIFKNPVYVTSCDTCIYVSDSKMKTVTKLNWRGEVKGKYVCTDKPCGVAMTEDGTVFVGYRTSNVVGEISGDCTEGQVVLKNIQSPQAVYWSADTCTMYTSTLDFTEERNYISKSSNFYNRDKLIFHF